ncbi:hypothetical protein PV08_11349 [Exophiala spinifera]|uniref:Uncharacterized protein n=1 Tax=Exophiala spinifera TaxID=91928 RepID=A0A0D1ZBJ6_9EURO|nr:uncharacterized protein PV08_11349 [Exophiala spinifera]KIW10387.1 hypothetical protein PV08_11349 [Exophiala spinifera]
MDPDYADQYRDLRSRRHARNRHAKHASKYYGYRGVHPSWVGQPHYSFMLHPSTRRSLPGEYSSFYQASAPLVSMPQHMKISTWTKRDMWLDRDTDIWPLDRQHHRGKKIREKRHTKWTLETLGRRMKAQSKTMNGTIAEGRAEVAMLCHDQGWNRGHEHPDSDPSNSDSEVDDNGSMVQDIADEDREQADHDGSGDEEGFEFVSADDFDVQSLSSMGEFDL